MKIFDVALAKENEARREWNIKYPDNTLSIWSEKDKQNFIMNGSCPSNYGCQDDCQDKTRSCCKCTSCFDKEVN